MKIDVVIVTYNRLELLKECIEAVLSQTVPFSEIFIVNNDSTDGTGEYLEKYESDDRFFIITEDENFGGAGGFYAGMAAAQKGHPDHLLLIDDDAILAPDYIEKLIAYSEKHPDHAALAGAVYTDGKIDPLHRRRITSKKLFIESPIAEEQYKRDTFACDTATFCGLLVNGRAFSLVGLPKAEYFLWYDDSEYSLRLGEFQSRRYPELEETLNQHDENRKRKGGYAGIMVIPEAKLNHKTILPEKGKSLLQRTDWRMYYGYRNRLDTAITHFGKFSGFLVAFQYLLFIWVSYFSLLIPSKREHAHFNIYMISNALHDGWNGNLGRNPLFGKKKD